MWRISSVASTYILVPKLFWWVRICRRKIEYNNGKVIKPVESWLVLFQDLYSQSALLYMNICMHDAMLIGHMFKSGKRVIGQCYLKKPLHDCLKKAYLIIMGVDNSQHKYIGSMNSTIEPSLWTVSSTIHGHQVQLEWILWSYRWYCNWSWQQRKWSDWVITL